MTAYERVYGEGSVMTEMLRTLGTLLVRFGGMGTVVFVGMFLFKTIRKQETKNTLVALGLCVACLILGIVITPKA